MRSLTRQAARALWRTPWYTASLAGVLALSLALSTTVFAIVDGALFKPLPYDASQQLFAVKAGWTALAEPMRTLPAISPAEFSEWRQAVPGLAMSAFSIGTASTVGVRDSVRSARVDALFFNVVGVRPMLGGFADADFQPMPPQKIQPAVVTYRFWRQRFGGDPAAIGRVLADDTGSGIRVAGVLPESFVFPFAGGAAFTPEVLTPLRDSVPRGANASHRVLVRLSASMLPGEATQRLTEAAAAWASAHPPPPARSGTSDRTRILRSPYDHVGLEPIRAALTASVSQKAWIVFLSAAMLILLACLNAASLTVARVRDRWRELAVRRALGARRRDLILLLTTENGMVVVLGMLLGILLSRPLLAITLRLMGVSLLTALKPPAIDVRVLFFCALAAIGSIGIVTLLSARSMLQTILRDAIAQGGSTTSRGRRGILILPTQIAAALIITVASALVAGSLLRVWQEDPGLDVRDVALVSMAAPDGASAAEIEQLVGAIGRIPGVARAGGTPHVILAHAFNGSEFDRPPGVPPEEVGVGLPIESLAVTHGYLDAAGLALHDGRLPTDAEFATGASVVVVSDTVARQYWPGRRAVGQSLLNKGREYSVVGVVPDVRYMSLDLDAQGEIYWPVAATERPSLDYVLVKLDPRSHLTVGRLAESIKKACAGCWVREAQLVEDALADTIQPRRFSAWLFTSFGFSALVIVGTGVLGTVAMTTNRRRREIGIRLALGSSRARVVRQLVAEQVGVVLVGLAAGSLVTQWLMKFVDVYLYKTSIYDPIAWLAAILALLVIVSVGAWLPATRASRMNPLRTLRAD